LDIKEFGAFLKKARLQKKMSTHELAKFSNVSQSYISHVESGRKKRPPSPAILKSLSEPLGIDYEELMVKAGYWGAKYSDEDKSYFESIYTESSELFTKIESMLKILTDDDGYFPDYLHKEIFKIFGGWLNLDDRPYRGFDKFYKYDFMSRSDPIDYFGEEGVRETNEYFNKIYNYTSLKNAIHEYRGLDKDLDKFLEELIELADRHHIPISAPQPEMLSQIELSEKVLSDISVIIRYNDNLLTKEERYRLIGFLDALMSMSKDRKSEPNV
jgi:transcriptional regulator with XRE-family HTH domain